MTPSDDFPPTQILGTRLTQATHAPTPPPSPPPRPPSQWGDEPERAASERLMFSGTGGEYFRIWIVNLLLNIVTLGIYSAWAKVRKTRYFYDSTQLAGSSFEYHGNPTAILKGRLIAGGLLVAYNVAPKISIKLGYAVMIALALALPWLIWRSLQFKLYNSSYRGIRFRFLGSCGRAYKVYLLYPILAVLTLGVLVPFTHQRIKKYQHDESRFGTTAFSFHGSVGKFYGAYIAAAVVFVLGMLAIVYPAGWLVSAMFKTAMQTDATPKGGQFMVGLLIMLAVFAWAQMAYGLFMTMLQNTIWRNTRLGGHRFQSEMAWTRVAFITLTNIVLIALTLGLFTPFATIRMMKYRIESMSLIPQGDLDSFVADVAADVPATGEGVTDLFDFDLAL